MKQVFQFLTQESQPIDNAWNLIKPSAWEALAYLEPSDETKVEDLQQAVPDYYNFNDSTVFIKLINPENFDEYGVELEIQYRIVQDSKVQVLDPKSGAVRDEWLIIGLDRNYLALDMGDVLVFFTHTPSLD